LGSITTSPFLFIYPYFVKLSLPNIAYPSLNAKTFSKLGSITVTPNLSINPHLLSIFTGARPSENPNVNSKA